MIRSILAAILNTGPFVFSFTGPYPAARKLEATDRKTRTIVDQGICSLFKKTVCPVWTCMLYAQLLERFCKLQWQTSLSPRNPTYSQLSGIEFKIQTAEKATQAQDNLYLTGRPISTSFNSLPISLAIPKFSRELGRVSNFN